MGRMKTLTPEARRAARVALYEDLEAGRLDIAATVRRMRGITGMTQEAFGEKVAGVSRLTLAQIERGEGNPTLETLEKVGTPSGSPAVSWAKGTSSVLEQRAGPRRIHGASRFFDEPQWPDTSSPLDIVDMEYHGSPTATRSPSASMRASVFTNVVATLHGTPWRRSLMRDTDARPRDKSPRHRSARGKHRASRAHRAHA